MRRGDHDAARRAAPAHAVTQCGSGRNVVGKRDANTSGSHNFGASPRERLRPESRVIADAKSLRRIFLRVNISGNRRSRCPYIGKRKIVGDNTAPTIGSKLDLWVRHCLSITLREFISIKERTASAVPHRQENLICHPEPRTLGAPRDGVSGAKDLLSLLLTAKSPSVPHP